MYDDCRPDDWRERSGASMAKWAMNGWRSVSPHASRQKEESWRWYGVSGMYSNVVRGQNQDLYMTDDFLSLWVSRWSFIRMSSRANTSSTNMVDVLKFCRVLRVTVGSGNNVGEKEEDEFHKEGYTTFTEWWGVDTDGYNKTIESYSRNSSLSAKGLCNGPRRKCERCLQGATIQPVL